MRTPKNLVRHELTGLEIRVFKSLNKAEEGISGKVVDETKNTLVILTKQGEKKVQKSGRQFIFSLDGKQVKVDGNVLAIRPEDRVKKKVKKWM